MFQRVRRAIPSFLATFAVACFGQSTLSTAWQPAGPAQVSTAAYGKVTGRVTAIAVDPADTSGNTVYLGTTGGGVWKSTNASGPVASVQFSPLTDNLQAYSANAGSSAVASLSIGAIAMQPGGVGVLLAGTGDPNEVADSYPGSGILRSADKGVTWSLVQQSDDGAAGNHSFVGESFAGFAWSTTTTDLVVAAVSSSARGSVTGAGTLGASVRGLYYSTDAGSTWKMATIQDGTQVVQNASSDFTTYEGNAVTSVVWNPVRKRFYAAVRYHGYYESLDGRTFTRLTAQPGIGLTAVACPVQANTTGLTTCPIFRGTVAAQPTSGDLFAITVNAANGDGGLYQDACMLTGTACASPTVLWAKKLVSTPLENTGGAIPQGSYTLALAALPTVTGTNTSDTLLVVGTQDIYRCKTSDANGCALRNTTNAATTNCANPAMVAPAQHAIAFQANATASLLLFGNDGGLWRSTDGVNQQLASCSSDDATHFDNLNAALGSLAEVSGFSAHPSDGGIATVALGTLGSAASTTSSTNATLQSIWTQLGTGFSAGVAIDQSTPSNWLAQAGVGISLFACSAGTSCATADFSGTPAIGVTQVNNDSALPNAPFLLDPGLSTNAIVGTCRVYRGSTAGGWTASNAISVPLTGPANSPCTSANGLIRSIAAGATAVSTSAAQTSGSPVIYAGLAGTATGGGASGGHIFRNTAANLAGNSTQWTDVTVGTVTSGTMSGGRFNPLGYDVSSIAVDANDTTGRTVYAVVQGINAARVYRSVNAGSAWTNITANLPNSPANAVLVDPNDGRVLYVALDTGVYVTTDVTTCTATNAQCWNIYGTGLPNAPVTTLVASTGYAASGSSAKGVLRAGTYGRGLWQLPLVTAAQVSPARASLSPTALPFTAQRIGSTSAAQTVTVTNLGTAPLSISTLSISAGWSETDNCAGTTLAVSSTCSIQVVFAPLAAGPAMGTLVVYGNVSGGSISAALTGTGSSLGSLVLTPTSLDFGTVMAGSTSAVKNITISNTGSNGISLGMAAVTGDFILKVNTCGSTLASQTGCTIGIAFAPTAAGARTGSFTIGSDAGSQVASLTGTGTMPATDTLSPLSLTFGTTVVNTASATQTVQLTNDGDVALTLVAAKIVSGDFTAVNGCGPSLASHSTCGITVAFVPKSIGQQSGTLEVDDVQRAQTIALSGTAIAGPGVSLAPLALSFAATGVGNTSTAQTVVLTNNGGSLLTISTLAIAGDFAFVPGTGTCVSGASLPVNASCAMQVMFAPTVAGARPGALTLGASGGLSQTAFLSGTGVDFAFAASGSTSATVANGKSAVFAMLLTPSITSSLPVTYSCTGAPANAKCTVVATYNDLSATTPVAVTVLTGTTIVRMERPAFFLRRSGMVVLALLLPTGCLWRRRSIRTGSIGVLVSAAILAVSFTGCSVARSIPASGVATTGGGVSAVTPPGTYNLTVTATAAGLSRQVPLTLTVTAQ